MLSLLPSIFVLGLAMFFAISLTRLRFSPTENAKERARASHALALATGVQAIHFAEETAMGFNEQFPALVGLPNIPLLLFIAFNVAWLVIWIISVRGLRSAHAVAFFAAWFLSIAGMLNGVGHPLMAVAVGSYFPGLITSPLIGLVSVWLWLSLRRATQPIVSNAISHPPQ